MPPSTAAVKALRPARKPIRKSMLLFCRPCATPAIPASTAPSTNATTMIRSTLIPIRRAVSGSWETACMPRPSLVRLTKNQSSAAQTTRARTVKTAARWMVSEPIFRASPVTTSICGKGILLFAPG